MLDSVQGFRIQPPVKPPATSGATPPQNRLQFLQFKDLYFSSASRKARIESFLGQTSDALGKQLPKPLVLHFGAADRERHAVWDRLFPAQDVAVVSVSPYWKHPG